MGIVNPFRQNGRWYKANLHTHTTTSDGEATVAARVEQYLAKDYDILAITDHNRTNDVDRYSTSDLLVISGIEMSAFCPTHPEPYHLTCLNVPLGFEILDGADVNDQIEHVKQAGGEAILSHPYWSGLTVNQLLPVQGQVAIEVYNATCTKHGKGFSSVHWDNLLDAGRLLPAIACDDTHRGRDIFMGWTMIRADELTATAVLEALRTGCSYASCGPIIENLRIEDGRVLVQCSPVVEVHFIAEFWHGHSQYAVDDERITSAGFTLREDTEFVRVEVVDDKGKHAWTNPLIP